MLRVYPPPSKRCESNVTQLQPETNCSGYHRVNPIHVRNFQTIDKIGPGEASKTVLDADVRCREEASRVNTTTSSR